MTAWASQIHQNRNYQLNYNIYIGEGFFQSEIEERNEVLNAARTNKQNVPIFVKN